MTEEMPRAGVSSRTQADERAKNVLEDAAGSGLSSWGSGEGPGQAAHMRAARGTADPDLLPHGHSCGARWSGANTSHCGACHRTFSSVGTFDRHRRGGACLDPAGVGMSLLTGRAYEVWGFPVERES